MPWIVIAMIVTEMMGMMTNVGEQDDTVMWDSQEVKWFLEIPRELWGSGTAERLWKLSYADLVLVWRRACEELKLAKHAPYQLRHGGPQLKSVPRYEKA